MKNIFICYFLLWFCFQAKSQQFQFVQWSDPQLGFADFAKELANAKKAIVKINELKPDFVIICGDMIHTPNDTCLKIMKKTLKGLKMPVYFVPGNHDLPTTDDENLKKYRKYYSKDFSNFDHKGVMFFLLNTQLWKHPNIIQTKKQENWLFKSIKEAAKQNKTIIVAGHIPLFVKNVDEPEYYNNYPIQIRKRVINLLDSCHVNLYLSGHLHYFLENSFKNVHFVTSETTSVNFDLKPPGIQLWTVKNKIFTHQFVELN